MTLKVTITKGKAVSIVEGIEGHAYEDIIGNDTREAFFERLEVKARGWGAEDDFHFGEEVLKGWTAARARIRELL